MKTAVYNLEGKEVGDVELSDAVFGREWTGDLVQQMLVAQLANKRIPWAHAKGRAEVSGGGKKPWKQKHTGRARHGSIRSPIWKGGGVSHGPVKNRSYELKVNKKMFTAALASALSKRFKEGDLKIVEQLPTDSKTKSLVTAMKILLSNKMNGLLVPTLNNKNIFRASANIKNIKSELAASLNVYDVIKYKTILIEKDAVAKINELMIK
jgi:large subunit ribosomal protein L4